jgi:hypothetical protein
MNRIKDPVLDSEARHDRQQEGLTMAYEKALSMATEAYHRGEFDDEIQDKCDPADAAKIALATLLYIDEVVDFRKERLKFRGYTIGISPDLEWLRFVPCQIRDFRATVDGVLERHAQEILEHD